MWEGAPCQHLPKFPQGFRGRIWVCCVREGAGAGCNSWLAHLPARAEELLFKRAQSCSKVLVT